MCESGELCSATPQRASAPHAHSLSLDQRRVPIADEPTVTASASTYASSSPRVVFIKPRRAGEWSRSCKTPVRNQNACKELLFRLRTTRVRLAQQRLIVRHSRPVSQSRHRRRSVETPFDCFYIDGRGVGFIAGMTGIGGGILLAPLMLAWRVLGRAWHFQQPSAGPLPVEEAAAGPSKQTTA
jgi:hypothetical protein